MLTPTPHLPYLPSAPVSQLHIECTRQENIMERAHEEEHHITCDTMPPPLLS